MAHYVGRIAHIVSMMGVPRVTLIISWSWVVCACVCVGWKDATRGGSVWSSRGTIASYPGLPPLAVFFAAVGKNCTAAKKAVKKSCKGRPGYEAGATIRHLCVRIELCTYTWL